ncbi:MAG: hypothetical protein ACRD3J_15710, partial [Thermoanaerobaculia bacterium]
MHEGRPDRGCERPQTEHKRRYECDYARKSHHSPVHADFVQAGQVAGGEVDEQRQSPKCEADPDGAACQREHKAFCYGLA